MISKEIGFKLAKLLKEKGFGLSDDDYVQLPRFYEQDGNYIEYDVHVSKKYNPHHTHLGADTIEDFEAHLTMMDNSLDGIYIAPTIAEVCMWMYKKHGVWVCITVDPTGKFRYIIRRCNKIDRTWEIKNTISIFEYYKSPTEAYEKGIEYVLTEVL